MEIEDVLQDVFLRVYSALPDFLDDSSHFTWLCRIAVNTSLNHLRRQSTRLIEGLECWLETTHTNSPYVIAFAQHSEAQVACVMGQLDRVSKGRLFYSTAA